MHSAAAPSSPPALLLPPVVGMHAGEAGEPMMGRRENPMMERQGRKQSRTDANQAASKTEQTQMSGWVQSQNQVVGPASSWSRNQKLAHQHQVDAPSHTNKYPAHPLCSTAVCFARLVDPSGLRWSPRTWQSDDECGGDDGAGCGDHRSAGLAHLFTSRAPVTLQVT